MVAADLCTSRIRAVRSDARSLYEGLLHGAALATMIVSLLAGTGTLALVYRRRFEAARYSATAPRWPSRR